MTAWWKSGPLMTVGFWQHSAAIQQKSVTWLSITRTRSLLQQAVTKPSECGACGPVHPSVSCRPMLPPSHLSRWGCNRCTFKDFYINEPGWCKVSSEQMRWPFVNTLYPCSFVLLLRAQHGTLVPLVQMAWCVSGNFNQSAWSLSKRLIYIPFLQLSTLIFIIVKSYFCLVFFSSDQPVKFVERSRPGVQVSTSSFSSGGSIITDYLLITLQNEKIFRGFLILF